MPGVRLAHRAGLRVALAMRTSLAAAALAMLSALAATAPPDELIDRAVECLEAKQFELARTYLDPAVIDERLTAAERSRAYYLRGYAFLAQRFDRSAAADYAHALASDSGNAEALNALGELTLEGKGVARDDARAFALFLRSARLGNLDAETFVGYALLVGRGTEPNVARARYWLRVAADAGRIEALVDLARSYRAVHAPQPDPERARALYESAIERGSSDALVGLGYMHLNGELGQPDARRAAAYFARAARAGSAEGESALATLYLDGHGVGRDVDRGRALLERAARAGYAPAQARLATLYLARGDETDAREALRWLRAAAEQDDVDAKNGLAWVLATTKHAALRDGRAAVATAEQVVANARSAATLDTLAAAYAETGQFDRASAVERDALAALDRAQEQDLAREFETRLAAYAARQPWRE